jgi:hypothetical protein
MGASASSLHAKVVISKAVDIRRHALSKSEAYRALVPQKWAELQPLLYTSDYALPNVFWAFVAAHPKSQNTLTLLDLVSQAAALMRRYGADRVANSLVTAVKKEWRGLAGGDIQDIQMIGQILTCANLVIRWIAGNVELSERVKYVNMFIAGVVAYAKVSQTLGLDLGRSPQNTAQGFATFIVHSLGVFLGAIIVQNMYSDTPRRLPPKPAQQNNDSPD